MTTQFKDLYPDVVLCSQAKYDKLGPESFFELFGVTTEKCKTYKPLLLALNYSCMGEVAETYGLFEKNGKLYEVYGTECSMWEFEGQWKPESTNLEVILHKINAGELGMDKGYNEQSFANELKSLVLGRMEAENKISYETASLFEKYSNYSKQFSEQFYQNQNVLIYDLLKDVVYETRYVDYIKPQAASKFETLFSDHIVKNDNVYDNRLVYCFRKNDTCLFFEISSDHNHMYDISISHKDIHKKDFQLFNISQDINEICETVVLSVLEEKNLFELPEDINCVNNSKKGKKKLH